MFDYAWDQMGQMFWMFLRIMIRVTGALVRRRRARDEEDYNG